MLRFAAAKVPHARLVCDDMTQVQLDEIFDVVLCVYDSINHLLDFAQWEAVFDRAYERLDRGGIFIFDINTERRLTLLTQQEPIAEWFGDGENLMLLAVREAGSGVVWDIRVFEHIAADHYRLHREEIREVSFPLDRVRAALQGRFRRVHVYDQQRARPSTRSGRLHFACTK
jgi:cyclopropane fatty-acyl-phospholipid synthase-like methyltransferase